MTTLPKGGIHKTKYQNFANVHGFFTDPQGGLWLLEGTYPVITFRGKLHVGIKQAAIANQRVISYKVLTPVEVEADLFEAEVLQ